MKSRILLTLASVLSIGLAQAAAHNEPVEIDQAARRSRENIEFAFGVTVGLLGPDAAEKMALPFGGTLTEAAIRGSILEESGGRSTTATICCSLSFAPTIALVDADLFSGAEALEFFINLVASWGLVAGSGILHAELTDNRIHPLTRNIRKGMNFGYQLRTIKNLLAIERPTDAHRAFVSAGLLGPIAFACKTAYDFWHR